MNTNHSQLVAQNEELHQKVQCLEHEIEKWEQAFGSLEEEKRQYEDIVN
jgi:cell division protein FtsB